jgi:hypothetical protein
LGVALSVDGGGLVYGFRLAGVPPNAISGHVTLKALADVAAAFDLSPP